MNIQNNVHEMEIKLACVRWLEWKFDINNNGILINEFSANKSKVRADLVYASPNETVAIEIKSNRDKTTRLENQVKILKKLYNRVEVITVPKHYKAAKEICATEKVGLHIVNNSEITTILKGRYRAMNKHILRNFAFPVAAQKRADFIATEEYYRGYLIRRYSKPHRDISDERPTAEIDAGYIRSLNPHHIQRVIAKKKRIAYQADLEALLNGLQSTQSSSSSSVDIPSP